jgi:hypothetical protein
MSSTLLNIFVLFCFQNVQGTYIVIFKRHHRSTVVVCVLMGTVVRVVVVALLYVQSLSLPRLLQLLVVLAKQLY